MPELAEVETFKIFFDETSLNQKIIDIIIKDNRILNTNPDNFKSTLLDKRFNSTVRHGKYLFAKLNSSSLIIHFGMTGDLSYFKYTKNLPPYSKVIFKFDNGNALSYISQRMFGRLDITDSIDSFLHDKRLGPDALKMTFEEFQDALKRRTTIAKTALMNQSIIAGIGNIYSDEILFQSHIHPKTKINDVPEQDLKILFQKVKSVLQYGISMAGSLETYSPEFLIPHRKKDGTCPSCSKPLERYEIQGRHGFFCRHCQKLPKK